MAMCKTVFQLAKTDSVEEVLTTFSQEYFSKHTEAYLLKDGTYAIDAGENDLRAVHDESTCTIKFIARYEKDIPRYDKKLLSFANKNNVKISDGITLGND
jgi:hypothetical protein